MLVLRALPRSLKIADGDHLAIGLDGEGVDDRAGRAGDAGIEAGIDGAVGAEPREIAAGDT